MSTCSLTLTLSISNLSFYLGGEMILKVLSFFLDLDSSGTTKGLINFKPILTSSAGELLSVATTSLIGTTEADGNSGLSAGVKPNGFKLYVKSFFGDFWPLFLLDDDLLDPLYVAFKYGFGT